MARRTLQPGLAERTGWAEWIAAAAGLLLTLGVVGYTLWEGFHADQGPPALSVAAEPAVRAGAGYLLPVTVRNASRQTAAQVEIRGVVKGVGGPNEERRASFAYVPGQGEAKGGLLFQQDPGAGQVELSVEGFADP